MFIHDCTDMDRYHGCPTLPCTPPGYHWGWFQFDLAKQMVAQAPRYGLTLLVEDCCWECRWCQADGCSLAHNCVCVDRGGLAGGGWGSHRLTGCPCDAPSCVMSPIGIAIAGGIELRRARRSSQDNVF
jgi:hypothetical protein